MKKRINVSAKIQARHTPSSPTARRDMASNHSRHQNGVGFAVVTAYYPWTYKSDRRITALELGTELPWVPGKQRSLDDLDLHRQQREKIYNPKTKL